jgi:hypothetical protein
MNIELTKLTKHSGPLTKKISLSPDGTLVKDGSACMMAHGTAERVRVAGVAELGALIDGLTPSQALALGALRPDLPDKVEVTTKKKLLWRGRTSSPAPAPISSTTDLRMRCWILTAKACRPRLRPNSSVPAISGMPCWRCCQPWAKRPAWCGFPLVPD